MKKSISCTWIGISFLMLLFLCTNFQNVMANGCACVGVDTLICGFNYQIMPETAGGEWSVLCDSTDGSVVFEVIDPETTSITVSNCGEYHLIYSLNDGNCIESDTVVVWFDDPSGLSVNTSSSASLEYDNVECHQSPPPSLCDGMVAIGGLPEPTVSWQYCSTVSGSASIFSTDVQGDMPMVCLADMITVNSENVTDFADLGCVNYSEGDFLQNFLDIIASASGNPFDSLNLPLPNSCVLDYEFEVDTLLQDSFYIDTMAYILPKRIGGLWHFVTDVDTLMPLGDTTNIVVEGEPFIFVIEPGADYYGPDSLYFALYEDNNGSWEAPNGPVDMQIQWQEFFMDTLIVDIDTVYYNGQNGGACGGFGGSHTVDIGDAPEHPCEPLDLMFNSVEVDGDVVFCEGESGFVFVVGAYESYLWNTGETSNGIDVVDSGTYTVTVTDEEGCTGEGSIDVQAVIPPQIVGFSTIDDFCNQGQGAVFFDIVGGTPPYFPSEVNGLFEGAYTFVVFDSEGCQSDPIDVFINGTIQPSIGNVTVVDDECDQQVGSITIDAFGEEPFTYFMNGSAQSDNTFSGLGAGTYTIEVVDFNGCFDFVTATVSTTELPVFSISGDTEICPGEITDLTIDGNFSEVQWSDGSTGSVLLVSNPGVYCAIVTSADGCTEEQCISITEGLSNPPIIDGDLEVCPGEPAFLTAESGFTDYEWSNGSTDMSIVTFGAGIYCVTVTNNGGCTAESCIEVTEFGITTPTIFGDLQLCAGTSGQLSIDNTYAAYAWSSGSTDANTTIANSGQYCVTVTSNEGCTAETCATVEEVPNPIASISGATLIPVGGSVDLTANGGDVYEWSTGEMGGTISVTSEGTYCVTVTNANGCTDEDCVAIMEDNSPNLSPTITGDTELCTNETGSLSIVENFATYAWSNGETTPTIQIDEAGTYSVTVSDGSGSTGTTSVIVNELAAPTGIELTLQSPICAGDLNGVITIESVTGGQSPFSYAFNGNGFSSIPEFPNLGGGTYEIQVQSETSGCIYTETVSLPDGDNLFLELGNNQTVQMGENVEIAPQNLLDETMLESIIWTSSTTLDCTDCLQNSVVLMEDATFNLTLIGESGCTVSDAISFLVEDNTLAYAPNVFSPNNDGTNDRFTIYSNNEGLKINNLTIFDRWGTLVYENNDFTANDENAGWNGQFAGKNTKVGVYLYVAELQYLDGRKEMLKGDVTVISGE